MFKSFTFPKLVAIAALTFALAFGTMAPTPAKADDNFRNFALGAAGIIVLGTILNQQAQARGQVVTRHAPAPQTRHKPRVHRQAVLPARCIRGQGRHSYVAAPCLRHSGYRVNALPGQCFVRFNNAPNGFGTRCLQRSGYQFG